MGKLINQVREAPGVLVTGGRWSTLQSAKLITEVAFKY